MELLPGIPIRVITDWGGVIKVMDQLKRYSHYGIDLEMTHPTSPDGYAASSFTNIYAPPLSESPSIIIFCRHTHNVLAILQVAVEDAVWILDILALRGALEEHQWLAFFRLLLCSEALKLGSFYLLHYLRVGRRNLSAVRCSGFDIRQDLQLLVSTFPCIEQLRVEAKNILCLSRAIFGRGPKRGRDPLHRYLRGWLDPYYKQRNLVHLF